MISLDEQKKNRKLWIEALRSGEYKQGTGVLQKGDKFCCLGVLCDVVKKSGLDVGVRVENVQFVGIHLTAFETDFVGLSEVSGMYHSGLDDEFLTNHNDNGKTFSEIADIIESEPKGLFKESVK